jgi:hypothetical protein
LVCVASQVRYPASFLFCATAGIPS